MKKRVNPRKRPASEADVEKSYIQGVGDGIDYTLAVFLYAMRGVFGFGTERLARVMEAFNRTLAEIDDGSVTLPDIKQTLMDETGIVIKDTLIHRKRKRANEAFELADGGKEREHEGTV